MKLEQPKYKIAALILLGLILVTSTAIAAIGLDVTWWTIDGGGGASSGGGYTLNGTLGQHDAGTMSNGEYTLVGGFWGGPSSTESDRNIYLPLVIR